MILTACIYVAFAALLVVAAACDMNTLRIPNQLVGAMAALWLLWRALLGLGNVLVGADFLTGFLAAAPFKYVSFADGILGAVTLGGGLLLVTAAYEAITKKRAMGGGDIKLLCVVGLFLGMSGGLVCLLVACVAGLLMALLLPRARWGNKTVATEEETGQPILKAVPFGPPIAVGAAVALLIM